jgi:hypothetical protein
MAPKTWKTSSPAAEDVSIFSSSETRAILRVFRIPSAPIPWEHIGLAGDCLWSEIDHPLERFRPLRTNRFNPKGFIIP